MATPRYTVKQLFGAGEITPRRVLQIEKLLRQLHPDKKIKLTAQEFIRYAQHNHLVVAQTPRDVVVGMAAIHMKVSYDGTQYEVMDVVVDKGHRGQGIARTLMNDLIVWAKRRQAPGLYLLSGDHRLEAHMLYESLGFVKEKVTNKFSLAL